MELLCVKVALQHRWTGGARGPRNFFEEVLGPPERLGGKLCEGWGVPVSVFHRISYTWQFPSRTFCTVCLPQPSSLASL